MARHSEAVAKSYAKALFELARDRNQVDAIATELNEVSAVISQQPQLLAFLSRPWVAAATKRGAIDQVATKLGLTTLTRDFLGLLAARNRVDHLVAIAGAYRALDDEAKGRVRVRLRTAIALNEAERQTLSQRLSRVLEGKQLVIEESVDPQLMGGFVVEVGSMILDGSLDTQLARIGDQLARA